MLVMFVLTIICLINVYICFSIILLAEEDSGNHWGRTISRRGMTVRRSLDVLSRQLDDIQKERNELKNALSRKEKEISDLIKYVQNKILITLYRQECNF